jgi:glucose-1-phosphate adenylyltransferase
VSGGCIISGSTLDRCLMFTGVHTHSFAELSGVVALPYADIGESAKLRDVVIDRGVRIPAGLEVGFDHDADRKRGFRVTDSGITLITQNMIDRLDS